MAIKNVFSLGRYFGVRLAGIKAAKEKLEEQIKERIGDVILKKYR